MIRTVLGDLEKSEISGNILTHEHVICASGEMLFTWGEKWLERSRVETYAHGIYSQVREKFGVSLIVDGTPCDMGRDVGLIRRVSKKSGVNFVASTGLYYYPSALSCMRSADDLAAIFIEEAKNGIPTSDGERILPGILKCAVDADGFTADAKKRVESLAIARRETGLPLYAHCRHIENTAHELLDILELAGASLEKVALGHVTSRLDADYLSGLLERGCYVDFDQCFSGGEARCAAVVGELCRRGFADKLLFSLDRPIYNDFEVPSRTGLDYDPDVHISRYGFLFTHMLPAFKAAGCTEEQCRRFVSDNALEFIDIN